MILYKIKDIGEDYVTHPDFAFQGFGFVFFTSLAAAKTFSNEVDEVHPIIV